MVSQGVESIGLPIRFLYSHAFELFFKAFLSLEGMTVADLSKKKFGHNLAALYKKCKELGLSLSEYDCVIALAEPPVGILKRPIYLPGVNSSRFRKRVGERSEPSKTGHGMSHARLLDAK